MVLYLFTFWRRLLLKYYNLWGSVRKVLEIGEVGLKWNPSILLKWKTRCKKYLALFKVWFKKFNRRFFWRRYTNLRVFYGPSDVVMRAKKPMSGVTWPAFPLHSSPNTYVNGSLIKLSRTFSYLIVSFIYSLLLGNWFTCEWDPEVWD